MQTGYGFRFCEAFNPIRTETIALVLTIVCHFRVITVPWLHLTSESVISHRYTTAQICFLIQEWATRKHIKGEFKEDEYHVMYHGIVKDIKNWTKDNERVWVNIRAKWYKRAL